MEKSISELLPLTADTSQFNKVFIPIEHDFSLELANQNSLNIYHLRTENRKFKYEDLTNFCVGNSLGIEGNLCRVIPDGLCTKTICQS